MSPVGLEPTISAGEQPQTYALDRASTGTGTINITYTNCVFVTLGIQQALRMHHIVIFGLADFTSFFHILTKVKEQRNILHEIRKRKANWIGHILRRNCLLQQVTEGKIQEGIEVTGRQGRRRRKLLDDLKEKREYSHLKEKALDRTM
jgi:hypothetical protein